MKKLTPLMLLLLAACSGPAPAPQAAPMAAEAPTNRIDVPPEVITSLGITFVKPERRPVRRTLRVPGYFESPPESRRTWTAPMAGRLRLRAAQYAALGEGAVLFEIQSPAWREMQSQLIESAAAVQRAENAESRARIETDGGKAQLEARAAAIAAQSVLVARLEAAAEGLARARDHWADRVAQLTELDAAAGGRAAEIAEATAEQIAAANALLASQAEHAAAQAQLEETRAALAAQRTANESALAGLTLARLEAATARAREQALRAAAAEMLGTTEGDPAALEGPVLRLPAPARVLELHASDGAWLEAGAPVLTTLDAAVRFRARALQADAGLLRDGLEASIVPPPGGSLAREAALPGALRLLPVADAAARTMDLLIVPEAAGWARPGITAEAEIIYDDAQDRLELAIPVACVVRDGLKSVIFVRDPLDREKVIRTTAELGHSDGRWVELFSGVSPDSEIVLEGAYELNLTAKPAGKGHFHADGTFHAEDH